MSHQARNIEDMPLLKRLFLQKESAAGIIFILVGVVTFLASTEYEMGTAAAMGPGYFPALVALVLVALGSASVVKSLRSGIDDPVEFHGIGYFFQILASVLVFAVLLEPLGLVIAIFCSLLVACHEMALRQPFQFLAMFVCMAAFCVGVFIYAFGMSMSVFWWR